MSQPAENDPNSSQNPPSQPPTDNPLPPDPSPPHNPARNTPPEPLSPGRSTPFSGRTLREFLQYEKSSLQNLVDKINQDLDKCREKKSNDQKELNERIAKLQAMEKEDREGTAKWLGFLDEHMRTMYGVKADLEFALGGTIVLERMMDVLGGLDMELDEEARMRIEDYYSSTGAD